MALVPSFFIADKNAPPTPPPLFVPEPGQKLTREQHGILRAQRAKAAEDEKRALFGSWTGAIPLTVLYDHCKKNDWDKASVSVVSDYYCLTVIFAC